MIILQERDAKWSLIIVVRNIKIGTKLKKQLKNFNGLFSRAGSIPYQHVSCCVTLSVLMIHNIGRTVLQNQSDGIKISCGDVVVKNCVSSIRGYACVRNFVKCVRYVPERLLYWFWERIWELIVRSHWEG